MKNTCDSRGKDRNVRPQSQLLIGIAVIGLGLLLLLDNLNVIVFRDVVNYWPVGLIVFGLVKLFDAKATMDRLVFSGVTLLGIMLLLGRLGYSNFDLHTLWPLMLILVGASVVFKALDGRRAETPRVSLDKNGVAAPVSDNASDSSVNIVTMLGGFERRISTQAFRGGDITVFMGGVDLDLRNSSIDGEAVLNVFSAMGGITLKVPTDWTVVLEGMPLLGGFDEKTAPPPNDSKRLIVKGYAIMGGVEVRN